MKWILLILVVVVVVALVRSRTGMTGRLGPRGSVRNRGFTTDEVESVKRAADEDVTAFGEDLRALDVDIAGHDLEEAGRQDYQRALDDYEAAKQSVAAVTRPDEVRHVAEILEDGRYAVACVRARVTGAPPPERRAPCFFNPQHGPSVQDVAWSPPGGTLRNVPVCAADADRVASGQDPQVRQVMVGPQRMPYWQAGPAYAPMTAGYFGAFGLMEGLFIGTMIGGMYDGGGYDQGYDQGYDAGSDQGSDGGDGGGYDSGDGGGFDGGGFDGGGFDGGGFDGGGF